MDLLLVPEDPTSPVDKTLYLCRERWDGGIFSEYASRKGKTHWFPTAASFLGVQPTSARSIIIPENDPDIPRFLQTWLYFGLVAEFLSLNETPGEDDVVDQRQREQEIELLHEEFSMVEGGETYVKGAHLLTMRDRAAERLKMAPVMKDRVLYLANCLHLTVQLLNAVQVDIPDQVRFSIAGLGETLSTSLFRAILAMQPPMELPKLGLNWYRSFVKRGSAMEADMLARGWCPSEIEKIRAQFQRINSMHYLARLKRHEPLTDHSKCSALQCVAFQIDMATYAPKHASPDCLCEHVAVNATKVNEILSTSASFPILRVTGAGDLTTMSVTAEAYQDGMRYVALSHVWADGLGNPKETSLPRCQIARLAQLVAATNTSQGQPEDAPLGLWVDTLCCPIRLEYKLMALQRIADVYRNATHVLVLDSALTQFEAEGRHPGELLLRVFACSPWTRRLWTLQEAALAKSLHIQFKDKAVPIMNLIVKLYELSTKDVRYLCIWQDAMNEYQQMQCFQSSKTEQGLTLPAATLATLQRALHFRTVTVPSDEALCVATLMALDQKQVAINANHEDRMKALWKMIMESSSDISARLLFYLEDTLDEPGWRWAPRTFLPSSLSRAFLEIEPRMMKFTSDGSSFGREKYDPAILTPRGIKVTVPGFRVRAVCHDGTDQLHPWDDMLNPVEDEVLVWHEGRDRWYRLNDHYRSNMISVWTPEERRAHDRGEPNPICTSIDTGKAVFMVDQGSMYGDTFLICMGQMVDGAEDEDESTIFMRRERAVLMSHLTSDESQLYSTIKGLAEKAALHPLTKELTAIDPDDKEAIKAKQKEVEKMMRASLKDRFDGDSDLDRLFYERFGERLDDLWWLLMPKLFSHNIVLEDLPEDQVWVVD